jgi:BlaI family penicillinase repressor
LNKVYQGSVGLMVSALAQDKALSKAEIDELYEILREAEEGEL